MTNLVTKIPIATATRPRPFIDMYFGLFTCINSSKFMQPIDRLYKSRADTNGLNAGNEQFWHSSPEEPTPVSCLKEAGDLTT